MNRLNVQCSGLINTGLQPGGALATMGRAAFSGFCSVSQAVETAGVLCSSDTGLKPGVNERGHEALGYRSGVNAALRTVAAMFLLGLLLVAATGCRTVAPLPPADLAQPGWRARHGQVVWTARRHAPEIAGELLLATHRDGRSVAQFVKTPFPVVIAQTTTNHWQIQFVPQNRTLAGRLPVSTRFAWLQLAAALAGHALPAEYEFSRHNPKFWRLENRQTGEVIEGYLVP